MAILKTLTINGTKYDVTPVVPASSVTLLASEWAGNAGAYSQVVEIPGVTAHTKVDLQPTSEQLAEFHYKVLAFVAENEGGRVTVYAIGDKPADDHTIQITKTEVEGVGKIRGNTVGTTMPRPDWNQTDPTKADYIQNKPKVIKTVNGIAPDEAGNVMVEVGSGGNEEPGAHDLMQFVALANGEAIPQNTDLDTVTAFGNYKCTSATTAKTLLNCPTDKVFIMRVGSPAPGVANYFYQEIIEMKGKRHYRYGYPSSGVLTWNRWRYTFDTNEIIPARFGGMGANTSSDLGEEAHMNAVQKFVEKMNEMAANIGMVNTTFKTPSGLNRKPVNVGKDGFNIEYNSHITAHDLLRLMVAVKHTPNVLTAMGSARCDYFKNGGTYYANHFVLGNSNWTAWAEENGYTILAAKGGSLSGEYGEIGSNGILNYGLLIQSGADVYAVSVVGLNNDEHDILRTIIHDLISGVANSTAISEAKNREYPVGMAVAKLSGGCFDEDITALENGTFYNEHEVRATASVAKIMTALVASHHMGNHECSVNYDDLVGGAEAVTFAVGDKISTTDALSLMLAVSSNAMATMLARVCGEKGGTGEPSNDYILTEADKQEIAEQAAELVEVPEVDLNGLVKSVNGVSPDENGNVEIEVSGGGSLEYIGEFTIESGVSQANIALGGTFKELYIFESSVNAAVSTGEYTIYVKNKDNHAAIAKSVNAKNGWTHRRFHIRAGMLSATNTPWLWSECISSATRNTSQMYGFGNYTDYSNRGYMANIQTLVFSTETTDATFNAVKFEIWGVRA